jgi:hypothetical protein
MTSQLSSSSTTPSLFLYVKVSSSFRVFEISSCHFHISAERRLEEGRSNTEDELVCRNPFAITADDRDVGMLARNEET